MGGRAKAGDKFMVEVDQFVIGLREPQFEKCKSFLFCFVVSDALSSMMGYERRTHNSS